MDDSVRIERAEFIATVLESAGRDADGEVPEWLRPGWLAEEVAPLVREFASLLKSAAASEREERTPDTSEIERIRVALEEIAEEPSYSISPADAWSEAMARVRKLLKSIPAARSSEQEQSTP